MLTLSEHVAGFKQKDALSEVERLDQALFNYFKDKFHLDLYFLLPEKQTPLVLYFLPACAMHADRGEVEMKNIFYGGLQIL